MRAPSNEHIVVIPVKNTDRAKQRLELPSRERQEVALHLATHTIEAVRAAVGHARVLVVSSDKTIATRAAERSVGVIPDPGRGLNAAAERGVLAARSSSPDCTAIVLMADLPDLTPQVLRDAITQIADASPHPVIVRDLHGTGTTMVALPPTAEVQFVFGRESALRFAALGYATISHAPTGLRRDLDTIEDLRLHTVASRSEGRSVIVAQRSMAPGYAGVQNPPALR